MTRSTWVPLLDGELRDHALAATVDIAEALRALDLAGAGPSLSSGAAGLALFYAYLARAVPERGYDADAVALLDRALALVGEMPMRPALYGGFTGVAWTIEHLTGWLVDPDGGDACEDVDAALQAYLANPGPIVDYDLISGLAGLGIYALERLPRASAVACLARIVELLHDRAEHTSEGITWWTSPALMLPETSRRYPRGYYNTGLAHGVPGIIAFLGAAHAAGIDELRTRALLDGAVSWLFAQELSDTEPSLYSAYFDRGSPRQPARHAWCYGDPGVAAALLVAGTAAGEPSWREHALRIARHAAEQPLERAGVVDACLCHGAASLVHVYNRMYQATGDTAVADVARAWARRLLAMRAPGTGIAGFSAWLPERHGSGEVHRVWQGTPGILMGAAGVGLALAAAATNCEPAWDRILLVSVPQPRGASISP